jgi:hypothetical protein
VGLQCSLVFRPRPRAVEFEDKVKVWGKLWNVDRGVALISITERTDNGWMERTERTEYLDALNLALLAWHFAFVENLWNPLY